MWQQLGLRGAPDKITSPAWGGYPAGTLVHKGEVLFPRIDLDLWQKERQARAEEDKNPKDPGDHEAEVTIDDFRKIELRVALVTAVEPVPKADKLYKMSLDLGYEKREIVSGIREFYPPEDLVGKRIVVICNLKPAKLRGVMSCGMLLAAEALNRPRLLVMQAWLNYICYQFSAIIAFLDAAESSMAGDPASTWIPANGTPFFVDRVSRLFRAFFRPASACLYRSSRIIGLASKSEV